MAEASCKPGTTRVSRIIRASRGSIYRACLDPVAIAAWRVPDDMEAQVHIFDARVGGAYRMSLTYRDCWHLPGGKTAPGRDTFHGRFIELVPDERIVEVIEFESDDPCFAGEMKLTTTVADTQAGTEVTILCQDIPVGIRPADNELGCRLALTKLARLLE